MKRKLFLIAICLMLCLSSMVVLSACKKEKVVAVGEAEATQVLTSAFEAFKSNSSKMSNKNITFIATENVFYSPNINDEEVWINQEGKTWFKYSFGEENFEGTKEIILQNRNGIIIEYFGGVFNNFFGDVYGEFSHQVFSSATRLKNSYSIEYTSEDNKISFNFTINEGKITNYTCKSEDNEISTTFEYGAGVKNNLPEIENTFVPEKVKYRDVNVTNLKTVYQKGEILNLEEVKFTYYDIEQEKTVEVPVTIDMLENFSTETKGIRSMTINYLGLLIEDFEYEVK